MQVHWVSRRIWQNHVFDGQRFAALKRLIPRFRLAFIRQTASSMILACAATPI
jgi:hypothetical protein